MSLVLRAPVPGDVNLITRGYVRAGRRALHNAEQMPTEQWDPIAERFVAACIEDGHCIVCGVEGAGRDKVPVAGYVLGTRSSSDGASRDLAINPSAPKRHLRRRSATSWPWRQLKSSLARPTVSDVCRANPAAQSCSILTRVSG